MIMIPASGTPIPPPGQSGLIVFHLIQSASQCRRRPLSPSRLSLVMLQHLGLPSGPSRPAIRAGLRCREQARKLGFSTSGPLVTRGVRSNTAEPSIKLGSLLMEAVTLMEFTYLRMPSVS